MSLVEVHQIRGPEDRAAAVALIWEFFDSVRARFPDLAPTIETYMKDHAIGAELEDFAQYYEPPAGHCFVAWVEGRPMGIVKLGPYGDDGGELNRMYVRPEARGLGCGKALVAALVQASRAVGYRYIYLDSLRRMTEAHSLYEAAGFRFMAPGDGYGAGDDAIVYMRRDLVPPGGEGAA